MSAVSKLYIWRGRGLLLCAQHIQTRDFTVGSDQLLVCLQGELSRTFKDKPAIRFRTVLLRAGTKVPMNLVDSSNTIIAVCYLNPIGQDYHALKHKMQHDIDGDLFHHEDEEQIIAELRRIQDQNISMNDAYCALENFIIPKAMQGKTFYEFDHRVITVVQRIEKTVRDNIAIEELASYVYLSESRLVKLFKAQVGIPITRYRLRFRVFVGVIYLSLGASVTDAALAAGFASTAHFSKCFSAMLGVPPSSSFLQPPYLEVLVADDILAAVKTSAYSAACE